ncbi:V-set and immunoglobulin domain-containing protein 8 [Anolis sagrei]|uniref:V-set and immunoglobulin domain-containing protein 8 n=1 Tax=Anolis sagrei TaxID=38937 RepID=UPI003522DD9B
MASNKGCQILLIHIFLVGAGAVRINEGEQKVIYLPKGESIRLGCPFASDPEDNTPENDWDIEWKQVKPGPYPQDKQLLGYHDHRITYPGPPELQQRVGFASPDPSLYDASMQLQNVQITDSATYECKVKKTTEASHKVTITVQERPAAPQCWIIGDVAYGQDIILRCSTSVGSQPLSYHWSMLGGQPFIDRLPGGSMGSMPGDYHIYGLCEDHVGTYQCKVGNNVGVAYCSVDIGFDGGFYYDWVIGGSVTICLLAAALIAGGVTWCCCCCRNKRCCACCDSCCGKDRCWDCCCSSCCSSTEDTKQECVQIKGNDICVDADAPPSRPCSQALSQTGSLHSLLGYQFRTGHRAPGCKYIPPIVQVKMASPSDSDLEPVSLPSSEQEPLASHGYASKRRDPYPLADSSVQYAKGKNHTSQSQVYSSLHNFDSPASEPGCVRWKDGNTKHYKSAVVMMQASTKEGLLI